MMNIRYKRFLTLTMALMSAIVALYRCIVNIKDGVVKGEMPGRALRMILEWLDDHRPELMENWELAQNGSPLKKIEPLK